jgi:hypothetical protein
MMNSVFLIDGGFFSHKLKSFKTTFLPEDVVNFVENVRGAYDKDYRLLRIYYYDCEPSDAKTITPISKTAIDYKASELYRERMDFLGRLRRTDFVSVREGRLVFRGWSLKKERMAPLMDPRETGKVPAANEPSQPRPFADSDFEPDFEQKGVDIKIGLDIAWISMGGIAQRIYLVTGDSDFVPAMKFARRSGVQVFYFSLAHGVRNELKDHADVLVQKPLRELLEMKVIKRVSSS